jgi:azurin
MRTTPLLFGLLLASGFAQAAPNCLINLHANDQMQYDQKSITVSHTCKSITIDLAHTGKLPVQSMGHNVVIALASDVAAVAQDGMSAGAAKNYIKDDDTRVIAHTRLIGGGEKTSISFHGSLLKAGTDYMFFCTMPGHVALMKGQLIVN